MRGFVELLYAVVATGIELTLAALSSALTGMSFLLSDGVHLFARILLYNAVSCGKLVGSSQSLSKSYSKTVISLKSINQATLDIYKFAIERRMRA